MRIHSCCTKCGACNSTEFLFALHQFTDTLMSSSSSLCDPIETYTCGSRTLFRKALSSSHESVDGTYISRFTYCRFSYIFTSYYTILSDCQYITRLSPPHTPYNTKSRRMDDVFRSSELRS